MIVIDIDTIVMKNLASASSAANEAIDNAAEALNRISTHNDWGCKEKNAINEYAVSNKNRVKNLQENSRNFLNVVTQAANDFESSENSIIDMFSSIESILSDWLKIGTITQIFNGNSIDDYHHTGKNHPVSILGQGVTKIIKDILGENVNGPGTGILSTPDPVKEQGIYWMGIDNCSLGNFTVNNFTDAISVCHFDDISL